MDQCFHILVSGRVQGVGYRNFVLKQARENQFQGQVRNLRDGRVEVIVRGNPQRVADFVVQLKKGPLLSSVENVDSKIVVLKTFSDFIIVQDGVSPWSFEIAL